MSEIRPVSGPAAPPPRKGRRGRKKQQQLPPPTNTHATRNETGISIVNVDVSPIPLPSSTPPSTATLASAILARTENASVIQDKSLELTPSSDVSTVEKSVRQHIQGKPSRETTRTHTAARKRKEVSCIRVTRPAVKRRRDQGPIHHHQVPRPNLLSAWYGANQTLDITKKISYIPAVPTPHATSIELFSLPKPVGPPLLQRFFAVRTTTLLRVALIDSVRCNEYTPRSKHKSISTARAAMVETRHRSKPIVGFFNDFLALCQRSTASFNGIVVASELADSTFTQTRLGPINGTKWSLCFGELCITTAAMHH